jgi:hypothetical protein
MNEVAMKSKKSKLKAVVAANLIALTSWLLPLTASAATIWSRPCKDKAGCFGLFIQGVIQPGDDAKLDEEIRNKSVKSATVALDSLGGNLLTGLSIGRLVRQKGYTTIVPNGATCTSACAVIWLAGSARQAEKNARVGFHAAYYTDKKGRALGESGMGNALVGAYYADLGLSDLAIAFLTKSSPGEITWLNIGEATKLGIKAEIVDASKPVLIAPEEVPQKPQPQLHKKLEGQKYSLEE